jgi:cytochrome P450/4-hydroxybenzoate polyprenyltransferase
MSPFATPWQRLATLPALVRFSEWHDTKLSPFVGALAYAVLAGDADPSTRIGDILALLALFVLYASFGHLVNDHADRDIDRAAGKSRAVAAWPVQRALLTVGLTGLAAAAVALAFFDIATTGLTIVALAVAALYSLPPARLKEKGVAGIVASALSQRALPPAIAFTALHAWDPAAVLFCAMAFVVGVRFILVHQLIDRASDARAGVRTFATTHGDARVARLVRRVVLPLEIILACGVVAALAMLAPLVAAFAIADATMLALRHFRGKPVRPVSYGFLGRFHSLSVPLALTVSLALQDATMFPLVVLLLALQRDRLARFALNVLEPLRPAAIAAVAAPTPPGPAPTVPPTPVAPVSQGHAFARPDTDPAGFKADPYPFYASLRAAGPFHPAYVPDLGRLWLVTRYDDAVALLKDPRIVRSRPGAPPTRGFGTDLIESDPPVHTRLRGLVARAFTPRLVERYRGRVGALARELLERGRARGEMDLVDDYATELPLIIITELLGIPIDDRKRFRAFAYAVSVGRGSTPGFADARARFVAQLHAVLEARRRDPRDDLVSDLARAEQDGDRLSTDEFVAMSFLLLVGGYLTTSNLIGNATLALLRHPDALAQLRATPALMETAIDEFLRFDGPMELSTAQYASEDLALGDARIARGTQLRLLLPAINRDPAAFEDPDRLDLGRDARKHLAFGRGIHYCLGAALARMEAGIALATLLDLAPGLTLAVPPGQLVWLRHSVLRGLAHLPVRLAR